MRTKAIFFIYLMRLLKIIKNENTVSDKLVYKINIFIHELNLFNQIHRSIK